MKKDQPVKTGNSHIKSVERAILLLEALAQEDTEMSLSQLSQRLGWPKSTIHGLLATLRDFHYVDQFLNWETGWPAPGS